MERPIKIDENSGYPYDEPETTIYCRLVGRPSQNMGFVSRPTPMELVLALLKES